MTRAARAVLTEAAPPGLDIDGLYDELAAAYATPPRAYHSLDHIADVVSHFTAVSRAGLWHAPREAFLAVLFHDAVYVAGRGDNERKSAELAAECIARHSPAHAIDVARVVGLIDLTARHGSVEAGSVDGDAALFLDCDMAILGAEPTAFLAYERAIRLEYAHVPDALFAQGRAAFLEKVLGSPRIFLSPYFHQRLDSAARQNLAGALHALGGTMAAPLS